MPWFISWVSESHNILSLAKLQYSYMYIYKVSSCKFMEIKVMTQPFMCPFRTSSETNDICSSQATGMAGVRQTLKTQHSFICLLMKYTLQIHVSRCRLAHLVHNPCLYMVDGDDEEEPKLAQLDRKEKMTYTEQAAKRKHCQRLTR